jgi:hypothetical protein
MIEIRLTIEKTSNSNLGNTIHQNINYPRIIDPKSDIIKKSITSMDCEKDSITVIN